MKKVSKRDIIALILLLIVGTSFLLYNYIYKPLLRDIASAKDTLESKESSKNYYSLMLSSDEVEKYEKEISDKLLAADDANAALLPDLKTTKLIHFFDEVAASCGIRLESIFFAEESYLDTTQQTADASEESYLIGELADKINGVTEEPGNSAAPVSADPPIVRQTFVNLSFKAADYEQLMAFLRGVENAGRSIYFDTLTLQRSNYTVDIDTGEVDDNGDPIIIGEDAWNIGVSVKYSLVAIDKLSDTDIGFDEIVPAENAGASDPFENQ